MIKLFVYLGRDPGLAYLNRVGPFLGNDSPEVTQSLYEALANYVYWRRLLPGADQVEDQRWLVNDVLQTEGLDHRLSELCHEEWERLYMLLAPALLAHPQHRIVSVYPVVDNDYHLLGMEVLLDPK